MTEFGSSRFGSPPGKNVVLTDEERAFAREALATFDWSRVDALTEDEIEAMALSDPDNPPLTDEQLAAMERQVAEREARHASFSSAAE